MTMKTIREWLQELPEPNRSRALANDNPKFTDYKPLVGSLASALLHAFDWDMSPEGLSYWDKAYTFTLEGKTAPESTRLQRAIELIETIANMERDRGVAGCTYGDTSYDSESAVYGYNTALDHVSEKIREFLANEK